MKSRILKRGRHYDFDRLMGLLGLENYDELKEPSMGGTCKLTIVIKKKMDTKPCCRQ